MTGTLVRSPLQNDSFGERDAQAGSLSLIPDLNFLSLCLSVSENSDFPPKHSTFYLSQVSRRRKIESRGPLHRDGPTWPGLSVVPVGHTTGARTEGHSLHFGAQSPQPAVTEMGCRGDGIDWFQKPPRYHRPRSTGHTTRSIIIRVSCLVVVSVFQKEHQGLAAWLLQC